MPDYASCCVLSYERLEFLATALSTLVANAGAPIELIVHDDGSANPEVRDLLSDLLNRGLVSTVILNPPGWNQGQGTALNRMFNMATGDPIVKLDQDLVFRPGWLRKVQEILVGNATDRSEPVIGLLGLFHYYHDPVDSRKTKVAQGNGWQQHSHICGSGFAVARECWRRLGPFEEHSPAFAEDWAFQRLVTESGDFVCALPDEDLVTNGGFGIGPSTVVIGEGKVQPINPGPLVLGR